MKPQLAALVALGMLGTGTTLLGQPKFDFNQPSSPTKPAPRWVKFIDQGQNDLRLKGYRTPEGVKVEIVAEFPAVANPVGMTFGDDGTLYVLEWVPGVNPTEVAETFTCKDGTKRIVATLKKPGVKDLVKALTFNKEKGVYEQAKVILEDDLPSGILLHDGWLYLSGRGSVRRFKQSNPGGPYDVKEIIAFGFGGLGRQQVSGMTLGNDGWLYLTAGEGDHHVEGSDGSRATVLRTGAIFRCRPDGSKMQVYSIGYLNPYRDVQFDTAFNMFHADNDLADGSKFTGCRLMHVQEGSDFGWRLAQGARCCQADPVRAAVFGELPGKLPPLLKTGRGAPAGLLIYNDSRFPDPYRGLIYYPDVFRKLIRAYQVDLLNSTFEVIGEFEYLKSDDPLFRPCQMVVGPDGAIYVCDWRTDPADARQLAGDGKHGRIYRLTWSGTPELQAILPRGLDSWARFARMSEAELLAALGSPDFSDRQRAQRELVKRGPGARPGLLKLVRDFEGQSLEARLAALGALNSFWNDDVQATFIALLREGEPDLRRLAADGLGLNCKPGDGNVDNALLQALSDQDLGARRAVVLAMGRLGGPGAADSLINTLRADRDEDPNYHDAILRGIERLGKPGIDKLLSLAESGVEKDVDKVVDAFLRLRTRAAAEAIPELLTYPHLSIPQRVSIVKSYTNYLLDPPLGLDPLVEYLKTQNEALPVKQAGLEVLAVKGVGKGGAALEGMAMQLLEERDPTLRLPAIGIIENAGIVKAAPRLTELLGAANCPSEDKLTIVKALGVLDHKPATAIIKGLASGKELPLVRVEALRSLAVLDPSAGEQVAREFLENKEAQLQAEGVVVLGGSAAGAKLVAEQFLAGKLAQAVQPQVAEALRKQMTKQPELSKLYSEVMKKGM